jgi:hypothetical protein
VVNSLLSDFQELLSYRPTEAEVEASATLQRVFLEQDVLLVLIDDRTADEADLAFIGRILDTLEARWDVSMRRIFPGDVAGFDPFVVSDLVISPQEQDRRVPVPVFQSGQEVLWQGWATRDEGFVNAFQRFVTAFVESGQFSEEYVKIFGVEPSYDPFEEFVAPGS